MATKKYTLILFAFLFTQNATSAINERSFNDEHVPGQLIIKLKESSKKNLRTDFRALSSAKRTKHFKRINAELYSFPKNTDLKKTAFEIQDHPDVDYVELNYYHYLQGAPNDPGFSEAWALNNHGQTGGSHDADIDALEAWDITTGSKKVLIGVIDTGVDYRHPDLKNNYWINPGEDGLDSKGRSKRTNGVDDDNNGFVDDFRGWDFYSNDNNPIDEHGHGTHCAGIIGGQGNNKTGLLGINWNVSIVGLKVFNKKGKTRTDALISAINYASKMKLPITNNSWGSYRRSTAIRNAVQKATSNGMLFVAAAGNNEGNNDSKPFYPASYTVRNVISVAATDHKDKKASFSNYGLNSVDIAAPGKDIYSTILASKGTYAIRSGTSMAAPHVAGAAGLLKAKYPNITATQMKDRILNYSDRISSLNGFVSKARRLNAHKALTSSK